VRSNRALLRCAAFAALLPALSLTAETFVVTTTADSGDGSLRQAIQSANNNPGSTITFAIGSGVQKIRPLTELPFLSGSTINGATQPGYSGTPLIEIDGSLLPALTTGLTVSGGEIRAIAVNQCHRGVSLNAGILTASFIGTDVTGQLARPNAVGVATVGAGSRVGGTLPSERNIISANSGFGVIVGGIGTIVAGNFIGTNVDGTVALPNQDGISVQNAEGVTIANNVLSGNTQFGVELFYANYAVLTGNLIGPSATGGFLSATQRAGISAYQSTVAQIGGPAPGEPNTIAYNADVGIGVDPTAKRIRIVSNSIHSNGFGIDLDFALNPFPPGPRVTPNDPGDADLGGNLLQNFPVLELVHSSGGVTEIRGSINTTPNSPFHVEFFSNASCNASGNGEGRTYLGSAEVVTNSSGNAIFETSLAATVAPEELVTATATDEFSNTSEFSACQAMTAAPPGRQFFTVTPCRAIDTRNAASPLGGPALAGTSARTFALAGTCEIPTSARSLSANVIVTQPSTLGHLTIHAADLGLPLASTINFSAGQTRANNAVLRLSNDGSGSVTVYNGSTGTVHLILDVNGYFE
jgi:parallel beta-helix repeat protein